MKTTPLIFNGDMVRALLEGRKTQTRRPVKGVALEWLADTGFDPAFVASAENHLCPFGHPGDLLWVRETCKAHELQDGVDGVLYAANGAFIEIENTKEAAYAWVELNCYRMMFGNGATVPSIHMPRWASRLTLRLTSVRIERVQDISERNAKAEGCDSYDVSGLSESEMSLLDAPLLDRSTPYKNGYALLWDALYGNWNENPWVWVLEFEVIRGNVDAVLKEQA